MTGKTPARRVSTWLLCLGLLLGPLGPGGAWHVAGADVLSSQLDRAALEKPSTSHASHSGPSCLTCQVLQAARAVVPATAVVLAAELQPAPVPSEPRETVSTPGLATVASRAPPRL